MIVDSGKNSGVSVKLESFSVSLKPLSILENLIQGRLQLSTLEKPVTIVQPINISIKGSSLFAILGGSGSGKTSLLNVVAGRYDKTSYQIDGSIDFGKKDCAIGYVTQSDYLLPFLTVRETLLFTARLKLDEQARAMPDAGRFYDQVINEVIMDLGLKECMHSRVGDNDMAGGRRGISGGEKRRVSVALQILTNPEILCADEPTSGLDSFTAITVMESLKRLTTLRSTTVISSVHQPRADIFAIFDYALVLAKGGFPIYCGRCSSMVEYFSSLGYPCPSSANPADFFIDLSSIDIADASTKQQCHNRVEGLIQAYRKSSSSSSLVTGTDDDQERKDGHHGAEGEDDLENQTVVSRYPSSSSSTMIKQQQQLLRNSNASASTAAMIITSPVHNRSGSGEGGGDSTKAAPATINKNHENSNNSSSLTIYQFLRQIYLLCGRFLLNDLRDTSNLAGGLLQALFMGLVIMGIFYQLPENTNEGIESRSGLMYIVVSLEPYMLMIILIERYCHELKIFDRELQDALYHPSAYQIAHILSNIPLLITIAIIFTIPVYFGCNLREGFVPFFIFFMVSVVNNMIINGLVWMSVSIHRQFSIASLVGNINFTFLSLSAGFLVNYDSMPVYVQWVKNISFLSYTYQILMENEFQGRSFTECITTDDDFIQGGSTVCVPMAGDTILTTFSVPMNNYAVSWSVILIIGSIYYAISMMLLNYLRYPPTGAAAMDIALVREEENEEEKEKERSSSIASTNGAVAAVGDPLLMGDKISKQTKTKKSSLQAPLLSSFHGQSQSQSNTSSSLIQEITEDMTDDGEGERDSLMIPHTEGESRGAATIKIIRTNEYVIAVNQVSLHVMIPPSTSTATVADKPSSSSTSSSSPSSASSKLILQQVQVEILPGRLVAIMGGSGSGKSTLMNLIANRIPHSCLNNNNSNNSPPSSSIFSSGEAVYYGQGEVLFNQQIPSATEVRQLIGYVQQFDFHLPSLTVYETLTFQARLRLPIHTSPRKLYQRVMMVIDVLGLMQCSGIYVGGDELKGISGGEKRRLSIGIQLLSNPPICLFDEPTTGLDAFTARHIVLLLKDLVKKKAIVHGQHCQRTMVLSIHQPRYDIFACIDDVVLLSRGELVWSGPVQEMLDHFSSLHYQCPSLVNPADFILDLSSIDFRSEEKERESKERLVFLVQAYRNRPPQLLQSPAAVRKEKTSSAVTKNNNSSNSNMMISKPDYIAYPILLKRALTNLLRQPILLFNRITQCLFYALILSCYYAPIGQDQVSVQNRIGVLYELTALCFIGMLNCVAIFPMERNVFYREYVDGHYSSFAFIASYYTIAIPIIYIASYGISLLITCAVGLIPTFLATLQFSYVIFMFVFLGECLGVIFAMIFYQIGFSVNVMSAILSMFGIMAGYISLSMPDALVYLSYISPLRWGSNILSNLAFQNQVFTCSLSDELVNGQCQLANGEQVLELYGFNDNNQDPYDSINFHYIMIAVITFLYFLFSIIVVRLRALKLSH